MKNIKEIVKILSDAYDQADRLANNDPQIDAILSKIFHATSDLENLESDEDLI